MTELPRQGSTYYIAGPPGTGKTRELSRQCARAAEKHGSDGVVIASLTRAAAAEIAGRTALDDHTVGTLHAHCYRALEHPKLAETGEGIKAWNEAHPHAALGRGGNRLEDATGSEGGDAPGDAVHGQVMRLRAALVPRGGWNVAQLAHDALWADFKEQTGRLDFTDLIERAIGDGGPHHALPRVLLVDEAQDLSRLELELVRTWGRHADTTVMAGDTDQAIFAWRGADPRAFSEMEFTGRRVLAQSHRVPRAVHALAMSWIRRVADRDDVEYLPTGSEGEAGTADVGLRSPADVADLAEAHVADGTVMVLASCGYMLSGLLHELKRRGTPFHNPYAADRGQFNPMRGAGRLKAYLAASEKVWGEDARCWTWDDLRKWTDPLSAKGVLARGAKAFIEAKCTENRFGETRAGETVPDEELFRLLGAEGYEHPAFHGDVEWWASHLRAKEEGAMRYPLQVYRNQGAGALAAAPRIVVGTMHSVKGGEASSVLICPDLSQPGYAGWRAGGDARDAIVRLFYVGVTRARERVTLLAPSALGGEHVSGDLRAALESPAVVA